jgi:hypothetical protein
MTTDDLQEMMDQYVAVRLLEGQEVDDIVTRLEEMAERAVRHAMEGW